mgnify:CR=1 FL=1
MRAPRIFLDTNVFVYALDRTDPAKRAVAMALIDTQRDDIVVSAQVLVELWAVCIRKLGLDPGTSRRMVDAVGAFRVVDTDRDLVLAAAGLSASDQLSIFDSLIVRAAQRAGCEKLMTEDLQAGRLFGDLLIENPFASNH